LNENDAVFSIAAHLVRCFDEAIDRHGSVPPEEVIRLELEKLHLCVDVAAKESLGRYEAFSRMIAREIDRDLQDGVE